MILYYNVIHIINWNSISIDRINVGIDINLMQRVQNIYG